MAKIDDSVKKKVPELRFKGFTDDWEERKLGEVFNQTVEYINPNEANLELWSVTVERGLTPKTARYNREALVKKNDKFKVVHDGDIVYNPMNLTIFPYMTGSEIQDIGIKFGISYEGGSRWQILQSILFSLHENGKTSDFFYYYLFKMNITSAVREVIDGNINAKPKYTKVEEIVEESEQNNKAIASVLRTDLINKINLELSVSDKKLIVLNEKIAIIDSKATPKVLVDPAEIMNIGYVKKILNNAKEDLLNNDLDSVVTKSRTIIETVFIVILRKHQIDFKENGNIGHYRSLVNKTLGMKPDNRWDENVSSLISGLNKIVDSITTMRNIKGTSKNV